MIQKVKHRLSVESRIVPGIRILVQVGSFLFLLWFVYHNYQDADISCTADTKATPITAGHLEKRQVKIAMQLCGVLCDCLKCVIQTLHFSLIHNKHGCYQ